MDIDTHFDACCEWAVAGEQMMSREEAHKFARRIRAEALEEAAHLCDIREREYDNRDLRLDSDPAAAIAYCASAIRALAKG